MPAAHTESLSVAAAPAEKQPELWDTGKAEKVRGGRGAVSDGGEPESSTVTLDYYKDLELSPDSRKIAKAAL